MTDGAFHGGEPRGQLSIDCSPIVHGPFAALSERRWPCESDHRDATEALESNRAREGVPGALSRALGSGGEALDRSLEKAVKQIRTPPVSDGRWRFGFDRDGMLTRGLRDPFIFTAKQQPLRAVPRRPSYTRAGSPSSWYSGWYLFHR